MAVQRSAYGNGRAMIADWGRTGSCQVVNDSEDLKVYEQISTDLAGGLHFTGYPKPLLQARYHLSKWSPARLDEWLLSSAAAHATARDFGVAQLLDDAVFGRQACAAFLASKFFGTVRKNIPALLPPQRVTRRKGSVTRVSTTAAAISDKTRRFLGQLDQLVSKALNDDCSDPSVESVLMTLTRELGHRRRLSSPPRLQLSPETQSRLVRPAKRLRLSLGSPTTASLPPPLKPTLVKMLSLPSNAQESRWLRRHLGLDALQSSIDFHDSETELTTRRRKSRVLAIKDKARALKELSKGLDPFLLCQAGRRVEPSFLGRGCVRISERTQCSSSPVVFWSPPLPPRCQKSTAPQIYSALLDNLSPLSSLSPTAFQLPEEFCNSSMCELETFQLTDSKYYILARATSGQVFTCTASYEYGRSLDDEEDEEGGSRWALLSADCLQPPQLAYKATSVAVCPWRPLATSSLRHLDWAVAGRRCGPPSGAFSLCHLGVVELFDSKTNSRSWHGQVPLNCPGENITSETVGVMSASSLAVSDGANIDEQEILWYPNHAVYNDLLGYCSEVIRTRQRRRLTPEQVLRRAELDFQLSHASTWLRVGFGGWPGQLALTTPKRLLTLDTRLPSYAVVAAELLNLNESPVQLGRGRVFNPAESIFQAAPYWLSDIYAVLATDYNCLLMDSRMPGRPVLHWSHALRAPLAFMDWCEFGSTEAWTAVNPPAQTMLVSASQFPFEVTVTGLNLDGTTESGKVLPPQVVGPALSGGSPGEMLSRVPSNLPTRLLSPDLFAQHLSVACVGIAARALPDGRGLQALSLSSAGDLFSHEWFFAPADARTAFEEGLEGTRAWFMSFHSRTKKSAAKSTGTTTYSHLMDDLLSAKENEACEQTDAFVADGNGDEAFETDQSREESETETTNPLPETCAEFYPSVMGSPTAEGQMELLTDLWNLWQPNCAGPRALSAARLLEEKKRQVLLDDLLAAAAKRALGTA
ncbi:hypothetical protein AAHC03_013695 [Spirometra sp. Aus1]